MLKRRKRRSLAERVAAFDQVEQRRFMRESVAEIAADLGISTSSIYRWQQERGKDQQALGLLRTISISEAVSRLCSTTDTCSFNFLEAVFLFNSWLRWPTEPHKFYFGIIAGLFQYLSRKHRLRHLSELHEDFVLGLLKFIDLQAFAEMSSGIFGSYADFELHNIFGQPYDELDAAADLAWFIIGFKKAAGRRPRFIDAYDATYNGVDKYNFEMSEGSFRKFWHSMLPSSAFLYAERYQSSLAWSLDPFGNHLVEEVDEIIKSISSRRHYFGVAFAVLDAMKENTDQRSWASYQLPVRPIDLEEPSFLVRSLPKVKQSKVWNTTDGN